MKRWIVLVFVMLQVLGVSLWAADQTQQNTAESPIVTGGQKKIQDVQQGVEMIWNTACTFLATNGLQMLINLIAAVMIFVIGRWGAGIVSNLTEKALIRTHMDATLSKFIRNLLYFLILIFVTIIALTQLGLEMTSFVAAIGAAGLAVGLALQGSLSNFAAGILLIIFKPFKVGDFVEIAGVSGTIHEIQIFNTVMDSPDNVRIIIPNAQVTGGNIKNYTANNTRRLDMIIGISYGDDIAKARQVITSVLLGDGRVIRDPAPTVAVLGLGESSVNIAVRPWVKPTDYWSCHFDLHEKIKVQLEQNGITIPFPQRDIHIRTGQQKV